MFATKALLVFAGAAFTVAAGDLKIDRWELTNTQFYEDLSPASAAGKKVYRLKRTAAADEGAERCAKERRDVVAGKRKELALFCKGLFTQLAPTFRLVLRSGEPGPVVLQAIDVEVRSVSVLKGGHGFFADGAYYDLLIKAERGQRTVTLRQPLKFTTLGSVELRLGFDLSPLGPATPAAAVEFILTFRVDGNSSASNANTDLIRIEL